MNRDQLLAFETSFFFSRNYSHQFDLDCVPSNKKKLIEIGSKINNERKRASSLNTHFSFES